MHSRVFPLAMMLLACSGGQSYDDGKDGVDSRSDGSDAGTRGPTSLGSGGSDGPSGGGAPSVSDSNASQDGAGAHGGQASNAPATGGSGNSPETGETGGDGGTSSTGGGAGGITPGAGTAGSFGGAEVIGGAGGTATGGSGGSSGASSGGGGGETALNAACVGVELDMPCDDEGLSCSSCEDACSFCWVTVCSAGVWMSFEAAPEPCFTCGSEQCRIGEYCSVVASPEEGSCLPLPSTCDGEGTCACLADAGIDFGFCDDPSGQVTVSGFSPGLCPTVVRNDTVYSPVASGCEPPCEGAELCHSVSQVPTGIPLEGLYECVDPASITASSQMRDDTLVCAVDEACLTHSTFVIVDEAGEPRSLTYETGRCVPVLSCPETPVSCDCLEQTCSEVFSDQTEPSECLGSGGSLLCVPTFG